MAETGGPWLGVLCGGVPACARRRRAHWSNRCSCSSTKRPPTPSGCRTWRPSSRRACRCGSSAGPLLSAQPASDRKRCGTRGRRCRRPSSPGCACRWTPCSSLPRRTGAFLKSTTWHCKATSTRPPTSGSLAARYRLGLMRVRVRATSRTRRRAPQVQRWRAAALPTASGAASRAAPAQLARRGPRRCSTSGGHRGGSAGRRPRGARRPACGARLRAVGPVVGSVGRGPGGGGGAGLAGGCGIGRGSGDGDHRGAVLLPLPSG